MNIFEYAKQMEKDGEQYYRGLSAKCHAPGFERILNWIAENKVTHYNLLNNLSERTKDSQLVESDILSNTKNVFQQMKDKSEAPQCPISEIELYKKALEIEQRSMNFYLEDAKKSPDHPQKDLFLHLAKEEGKHIKILQNLVDFVSTPDNWLENAEWYHLDSYPPIEE